MGLCSCVAVRSAVGRVVIGVSIFLLVGCQNSQPNLTNRLAAHVALVDQAGLLPDTVLEDLKVEVAVPHNWIAAKPDSTAIYQHQQWKSPSKMTGVGVVYIRMPIPLSPKTLVWLARSQYSKTHKPDGKTDPKVLSQWTDSLGREWFEGENDKYHVTGYIVTNGLDAWAIYSGYRLAYPKNRRDISMAFRCMDSIVPLPLKKRPMAVTVFTPSSRSPTPPLSSTPRSCPALSTTD
jgi:hypothetical protein